jgi:hypothetical protein
LTRIVFLCHDLTARDGRTSYRAIAEVNAREAASAEIASGREALVLKADWLDHLAWNEADRVRKMTGIGEVPSSLHLDDMTVSFIEHATEFRFVGADPRDIVAIPFLEETISTIQPGAKVTSRYMSQDGGLDDMFAREVRIAFAVHVGAMVHDLAIEAGAGLLPFKSDPTAIGPWDIATARVFSVVGPDREVARRRLGNQYASVWGDDRLNDMEHSDHFRMLGLTNAQGAQVRLTPVGMKWFAGIDDALYSSHLYEELLGVRHQARDAWPMLLESIFKRLAHRQERRMNGEVP